MPPLNTFDKTLISMALAQATMVSHAANITVSDTCSLANAIRSANQSLSIGGCAQGVGQDNTIVIAANETITLSSLELDGDLGGSDGGLPLIESSISIQGNGSTIERSSAPGTPQFRLFGVTGSNSSLSIDSATLRNGAAFGNSGGYGGAIYFNNYAEVIITDSVLSGNTSGGYGGAIYGYQVNLLEIDRSELSGNSASYKGGAIAGNFRYANPNDGLKIYSSLLSKNVADLAATGYVGGAISLYGGDNNVIANTTISNNAAAGGGAIYLNAGELELINTTISNNTNTDSQGGVWVVGNENYPPKLTLLNTVIANSSNGVDCSSNQPVFSAIAAYSWVENIDSSCASGAAILAGVTQGDPKLGSLANNGGTTKSQAPLPNSGLLGAGDAAICDGAPIGGIDQIMQLRGMASCTIGAVENAVNPSSMFVVPLSSGKSVIFEL